MPRSAEPRGREWPLLAAMWARPEAQRKRLAPARSERSAAWLPQAVRPAASKPLVALWKPVAEQPVVACWRPAVARLEALVAAWLQPRAAV